MMRWLVRATMLAGIIFPFLGPERPELLVLFLLPPILSGAGRVAGRASIDPEPEADQVSSIFWSLALDTVAVLFLATVLSNFADGYRSGDVLEIAIFLFFPALSMILGGCYLGLAATTRPEVEVNEEGETLAPQASGLKVVLPAVVLAFLGTLLCWLALYQAGEAVPHLPLLPMAGILFLYPILTRIGAWARNGKRVGRSLPLTALFVVLLFWLVVMVSAIRSRPRGSQLTACKSNLKNIGTALEMYSTDWSGRYPTSESLLTPNYLKTLPTCPSGDDTAYSFEFGPGATYNTQSFQDYYFVYCTGDNHKNVSVPANYPQYSGIVGLIER